MDVVDMPEEVNSETCPICLEKKKDQRMLPCWHNACLTCVLSMTQGEQGRAVTCHMCREPCLFESIRSLPRPVRCNACNGFVKNPKKFPCCSNLQCSDCINMSSTDGRFACQNFCTLNLYNAGDLSKARICLSCLSMHTEEPIDCGHSLCVRCYQEHYKQNKKCPLCVAIASPPPIPANSFHPPHGQGQALLVLQMMTMLREINAAQQQRQQQELEQVIEAHIKVDLFKGAVFFVLMSIAFYWLGLNFWLWAIGYTVVNTLKPSLICVCILCLIVNVVFFVASFYYYVWNALVLFLVDLLVGIFLGVAGRTSPGGWPFQILAAVVGVVMLIVTVAFFPAIFVHRLAITVVVQNVGRNFNITP